MRVMVSAAVQSGGMIGVMRLMRLLVLLVVGALPFAQSHLVFAQSGGEGYWPQWRGPDATGSANSGTPPISWDEEWVVSG